MLLAAMFAGCGEETISVVPAPISDLRAEAQEGAIRLSWNTPLEGDFFYARIEYVDPLTDKLKKVNISHFANEYLLDGLYRKNGEYTFHVYTVSSTGTVSVDYEEVSATPLKVPPTYTASSITKVPLTVDMLSSNASDTSEGNLADLLDENTATYWHSNWHTSVPFPNYYQINLTEQLKGVKFKTTNRNRSGYGVNEVQILGSNDGDIWTIIGEIPADTFPDAASAVYETPIFSLFTETGEAFSMFRFNVLSVYATYWSFAEFELYKVEYTMYDPEA